MVIAASGVLIESIAADLAAVHEDVIAAGLLGGDAEVLERCEDDIQLPRDVVEGLRCEKGEIEVAQIMIHRATTRKTAGEVPAVGF